MNARQTGASARARSGLSPQASPAMPSVNQDKGNVRAHKKGCHGSAPDTVLPDPTASPKVSPHRPLPQTTPPRSPAQGSLGARRKRARSTSAPSADWEPGDDQPAPSRPSAPGSGTREELSSARGSQTTTRPRAAAALARLRIAATQGGTTGVAEATSEVSTRENSGVDTHGAAINGERMPSENLVSRSDGAGACRDPASRTAPHPTASRKLHSTRTPRSTVESPSRANSLTKPQHKATSSGAVAAVDRTDESVGVTEDLEPLGEHEGVNLRTAVDAGGRGDRRRESGSGSAVSVTPIRSTPANPPMAGGATQRSETEQEIGSRNTPQCQDQTNRRVPSKPERIPRKRSSGGLDEKPGVRGGIDEGGLPTSMDEDFALALALYQEQEGLLAVRARIRREVFALQQDEDEVRHAMGLPAAHQAAIPPSPPRKVSSERGSSRRRGAAPAPKSRTQREHAPSVGAESPATTPPIYTPGRKPSMARSAPPATSSISPTARPPAVNSTRSAAVARTAASASDAPSLESVASPQKRQKLQAKIPSAENDGADSTSGSDGTFDLEKMLLDAQDDDGNSEGGGLDPDFFNNVGNTLVAAEIAKAEMSVSGEKHRGNFGRGIEMGKGRGRGRRATSPRGGRAVQTARGGGMVAPSARGKPRTKYSPIGADVQVKRRPSGRGGASLGGSSVTGRGLGRGGRGGPAKAILAAGQGGSTSGASAPPAASSGKTSKQRMIEAQLAALEAARSDPPDG